MTKIQKILEIGLEEYLEENKTVEIGRASCRERV